MKKLYQHTLVKVLSLNSMSVAVSMVTGILSTKIIAMFLGAPGMALLGSFRNFATMAKSASTLGINNAIVKLYVENKDDKEELAAIYSTFFWLFIGIAVFFASLIIFFAAPLSQLLFYTRDYTMPVRFFGIMIPLIVLNTFWIAIYNGMQRFKRLVVIQILSNVAIFLVTALLIWKQNLVGGLLSIAIGELVMLVITLAFVLGDFSIFRFDLQRVISKRHFIVIRKFLLMALVSAILAPLTLLLIRNQIVQEHGISEAGLWDAVNRVSGFYMILFSSGLTLYYMPRLASLRTDAEFLTELKLYFKSFVPIFLLMLVALYFIRGPLVSLIFTAEFHAVSDLLIWQLLGDLARIMGLALGFQIVVKTMLWRYLIVEVLFNAAYYILATILIPQISYEGAVQSYFYANVLSLATMIYMFRELLFYKNAR